MIALDYGGSAARITCPHQGGAAPAAATVTILDADGSTLLASTPATVGTASTTVGTAVVAGDTSLVVASGTGISVGDSLLLTDAAGRDEVVEVVGIDGTTVHVRDRISRAYAVGSAVVSAMVYYDADISDTDTYPADIYYQAIFASASWDADRGVIFRTVDLRDDCPITYAHVRRWLPHASIIRDGYDDPGLDDVRSTAWEIITARLLAAGRDTAVLRDSEDIASAGGLLAAGLLLLAHGHIEHADRICGDPVGSGGLFADHWAAVAKTHAWYDEDQDRIVDRSERRKVGRSAVGRGI